MRERRNNILQRVVKAIPTSLGECYVEQKVSGSPGDLRPDIVIINRGENVAVPFESPASFSEVRKCKIEKYTPLARWLEQERELRSSVHAFLVGSLGSWDPDNKGALDALKVPAESRRRLKRRCAAETLQGSNNIWRARR